MLETSTDAVHPSSPEDLAEAMGRTGASSQTIELGGHFSKRLMGGPAAKAGVTISTSAMHRVRDYEPRDLTISVEAGVPYCELSRLLAGHRQMIPLDPPYSDAATIGGIVAANCSGPRRRLYGTARDLVIGMQFATLEGKLVQSGGMVVKNVAGLDMGKLMIGSFGTLAAIAVVNFKLLPQPLLERTFLFSCAALEEAMAARDAILKSALQPAALDLLNPPAAAALGRTGWVLALEAGGNAAAVARYERDLAAMGAAPMHVGDDAVFWRAIQNFTPHFLRAHPHGAVARVSCRLKELRAVVESIAGPAVARAGSGVCYAYFEQDGQAAAWVAAAAREYPAAILEFAPDDGRESLDLWPAPGPDLQMMQRIKRMFDPRNLLNRGRLYGRI